MHPLPPAVLRYLAWQESTWRGQQPKRRQAENLRKLNRDRRRHFVGIAARLFKTGRTFFTYEGRFRHALRSKLCLEGWKWADADAAADDVIQAALNQIGAQRPTWQDGQRFVTLGPDQCNWCVGPMSDHDMIRGKRFCSPECAKAAIVLRSYGDGGWQADALAWHAHYIVKLAEVPKRICAQCSRPFRSTQSRAIYCSIECRSLAARTLPDKICESPGCSNIFHPRNHTQKFCCHSCSRAGRAILPVRECRQCGEPFQPKNDQALYCSKRCLGRSKDQRKRHMRHGALMNYRVRPCPQCGRPFRPSRKTQKFCSESCQKANSRRRLKSR